MFVGLMRLIYLYRVDAGNSRILCVICHNKRHQCYRN